MKPIVNETQVDAIDQCFNLTLRQADRVLTSYYDGHLRECGIKITQFSILRCLFLMQETSQNRLEKVLVINQATLTRNLSPLIKSGYVIRSQSNEDGRVRLISLSSNGEALYRKASKKWQVAQNKVAEELGQTLCGQLSDVADAILSISPDY